MPVQGLAEGEKSAIPIEPELERQDQPPGYLGRWSTAAMQYSPASWSPATNRLPGTGDRQPGQGRRRLHVDRL